MSYIETWDKIASRIKGLQRSGELYGLFQSYHQEDSYGAGRMLREQCELTIISIEGFLSDFKTVLPSEAADRLSKFIVSAPAKSAKDATSEARATRAALVALGALEAEVTYLLAGRDELIRIRSERAILHLQRSLVVDQAVSQRWQSSLKAGEVECEKQGSVHFLAHGIYAFKVNGDGGRTDLVFGEPPRLFRPQPRGGGFRAHRMEGGHGRRRSGR